MLPYYDDITSRIDEDPLWYGSRGEPRYELFSRNMLGVYDDCCILVRIACQNCKLEFCVGEGSFIMDRWNNRLKSKALSIISTDGLDLIPSTNLKIGQKEFDEELQPEPWIKYWAQHYHYGDPPSHEGCVGETMNCIDIEVLEAWYEYTETEDRPGIGRCVKFSEWRRMSEVEGSIPDRFAEGEYYD